MGLGVEEMDVEERGAEEVGGMGLVMLVDRWVGGELATAKPPLLVFKSFPPVLLVSEMRLN